MGKFKNEEGYVLIVVILFVVLIMSFSSVFMANAITHTKQEETVDQQHLVVNAAEMGVDYYSSLLKNEFVYQRSELIDLAESEINSVLSDDNFDSNLTGVQETVLEELESILEYRIEDMILNDNKNNVSDSYIFRLPYSTEELEVLTVDNMDSDNQLKVIGDIIGENIKTNKKVILKVEQLFTLPNFIANLDIDTPDENINPGFESNFENLRLDCPLPGPPKTEVTEDCLFESFITSNQGNNYEFSGAKVKVDGHFEIKNSFRITNGSQVLINSNVDIKNSFKIIDSNLLVNGDFKAGHGNQPEIENSRICVNGKFTEGKTFKFVGASNVFIFPSEETYSDRSIHYLSDEAEFKQLCNLEPTPIEGEEISLPDFEWEDSIVDVEYQ